jgi:DNA mismatch repair protein MSH5
MGRRADPGGDPSVKRWNASIRMANFASFDQSPLCVSSKQGYMRSVLDFPPQLGAVGALLDHLVRERAVGDLSDEGLEVRGIELLTLCVHSIPLVPHFPDHHVYLVTV